MSTDPGTFEHVWAGWVRDVFTLDGEEIWVGEDGGRIRRRDPAGGSWSFQPTPKEVRAAIQSIHFLTNGLTGFAASADGFLLKTQDGGASWGALARIPALAATQIAEPDRQHEQLFRVRFAENAVDGWLLGERGILYTEDGGVCWKVAELLDKNDTPISPTVLADSHAKLYGLDLRLGPGADFLGLVVGQPGFILRSTTQGRTWRVVLERADICTMVGTSCLTAGCGHPSAPPWFELWDVELGTDPASAVALAVGGVGTTCGLVLASHDQGLTWVRELHECEHAAEAWTATAHPPIPVATSSTTRRRCSTATRASRPCTEWGSSPTTRPSRRATTASTCGASC